MADKTLYTSVEKPAKDADISLVPLRERDKKPRKASLPQSRDDKETLARLQKRWNNLDASRPDSHWYLQYRQWLAEVVYKDDGTANINLPLEKAVIRSKIADEEAQKPLIEFLPTSKQDVYKKSIARPVWDFVWTESDTDKEMTKMKYGKNIFGTAWWYEGVMRDQFIRYVPEYGKDGKITKKPVTEVRSWIGGKALDIRNVWVDAVPDIEEAQDCFILQEHVSEDELVAMKSDPNYDADQIDALIFKHGPRPMGSSTTVSRPFQTEEEETDSTEGTYSLFHYYNKRKGLYIVTDDSFSFILRNGVLPFPHGELPISPLVDHPNYMSLYGYGECEMLENTKYERNTIRNQIIDYARASNTMNFAVGQNVAFEDSELVSGVMKLWNFNGDLGNSQFIKPPSMDSALFNVEEMLKTDATWITGIDVNSLAGSPSKTALEARLQEQNKLKGIAVSIRQTDYFLTRMARQRLANIQAFLPMTTGRRICGEKGESGFRQIPLQGMEASEIRGIEDGKTVVRGMDLKKKEGHTEFFELTPERIKNSFDIQVVTPSTTPILKELDKYDLQEVFNTITQIASIPQFQKFLDKVNVEEFFERRLENAGFEPDDFLTDDSQEQEKKYTRQELLGDLPLPPHAPNQPTKSSLIPETPGVPAMQSAMPPQLPPQ